MPKLIDTHVHVRTTSSDLCIKDCDILEKQMDEAGIIYSLVMSLANTEFETERDLDILLEETGKRERLIPILCYDDNAGNSAIEHLIKLLDSEDGICGVKFFTGYDNYFPTDDRIKPVLDKIESLGLVAKFHTGATERTENALLRYSSDPYSFDELATARPNLKIDCAHFMGPNHLLLSPVLDKNPNVYVDLSGLIESYNKDSSQSYLSMMKYRLFDAISYLPDVSQIMFGSDVPFCKPLEVASFFENFFDEYEFSDESRDKIRYKNAAEFYGIEI